MTATPPRLDFIAAQLRKPSGDFAANIAQNMDKTNEALFDLTLRSMGLQDSEHLLEIGFGSGRFMDKLLIDRDHLKVNGIDYSPEMVAMARQLHSDLINSGRLAMDEGNSERLPFADGTFDKVYCNMVIYFWDQADTHLQEVRRILKPGGKFYSGFRTKASMSRLPFVKFGFNLYELNEWQTILEKNGFALVGTDQQQDPELETNGQKIQLESVCMVAQKTR